MLKMAAVLAPLLSMLIFSGTSCSPMACSKTSRNSWQSNDAIPNLHLPFTDELRWLQMHASPTANGDVMVEHYLIRHERRAHRASAKA